MKKSLDRRYRAWTFILYPGDIPNDLDWYCVLDELHIPIAISPLHDMLLEGKPGEKDHYHVIISFDGKKSYDQVWELLLENLSKDGIYPIYFSYSNRHDQKTTIMRNLPDEHFWNKYNEYIRNYKTSFSNQSVYILTFCFFFGYFLK